MGDQLSIGSDAVGDLLAEGRDQDTTTTGERDAARRSSRRRSDSIDRFAPYDPDQVGAGDFDLDERNALRRVAGMSTELEDVSEVEYRQLRLERVVLVGVWTDGTEEDADNSLAELKLLAETAGSQVLDALSQRRQKPDPATYIGPRQGGAARARWCPAPAPTR